MNEKKFKFKTIKEMVKNINNEWANFLVNHILFNAIGTVYINDIKSEEALMKVLDYLDEKEFEYSSLCENNETEALKCKDFYDKCYECCDYIYSLCDETFECMEKDEK